MEYVRDWLIGIGWPEEWAFAGALLAGLAVTVVFAELLRFVGQFLFSRIAPLKDEWIEAFKGGQVFRASAWVLVIIVTHTLLAPLLFPWPDALDEFKTFLDGALVVAVAVTLSALVMAVASVLQNQDPDAKRLPIKVLGQALQLVLWTYATVLFVSVLTHKDVTTLLTGLTALGALLVYVFRDPILGWTASVQIAANDLAWIGDWITVPAHDANGRVIEMALTTIKVRNWDETVSTIPTYALVSEGFRNWRGMYESGGRRFRRPVAIDASTVRVCDDEFLGRLRREPLLQKLLERETNSLDDGVTNLTCFRYWLEAWLSEHPKIHQGMRILVRELESNGRGVPVEITASSSDTNWAAYERVQADIYDRVLTKLSEFDLRPFQEPSGVDVRHGGGSMTMKPC